MQNMLNTVGIVLIWCAIITGTLVLVAGFFWIFEQMFNYIIKHLKVYKILIEFAWNREKYKRLLKEEDYDKFPDDKN